MAKKVRTRSPSVQDGESATIIIIPRCVLSKEGFLFFRSELPSSYARGWLLVPRKKNQQGYLLIIVEKTSVHNSYSKIHMASVIHIRYYL